jgi:hypothetical protein
MDLKMMFEGGRRAAINVGGGAEAIPPFSAVD